MFGEIDAEIRAKAKNIGWAMICLVCPSMCLNLLHLQSVRAFPLKLGWK